MKRHVWVSIFVLMLLPQLAFARPGVELGDDWKPKKNQQELTLEQAMERASALALMEVTEITEIDSRAADGPLSDKVTFKKLRGSGTVSEEMEIIKASSGFNPENDTKSYDPLNPTPFKKGDKVWILRCSSNQTYAHDILMWWLESDKNCPAKTLEAAVKEDRYEWSPQFIPDSEFSYGHKVNDELKLIHLRVMRGGKKVWEKAIACERLDDPVQVQYNWMWTETELIPPAKAPPHLLGITARAKLKEGNEWKVTPGEHRLTWAYDIESGKTAAFEIQDAFAERFDIKTGAKVYEESHRFAGKDNAEFRKRLREYDAAGKLVSEREFRVKDSKYVEIDKDIAK